MNIEETLLGLVSLKLNLPTSSGLQAWHTAPLLCPSILLPWGKKTNVNCKHPSLETQWCVSVGANVICISEELQRNKEWVEHLFVLNLSHFHQSALVPIFVCSVVVFQVGHILFFPLFPKSSSMNIETCKENISFLVPRTEAASRKQEKSLQWKSRPNP